MDLYPDVAIALGELPPTGASKIFRTLMRWAYHRCSIVVALDDDMAAHLKEVYGVETKIISPWAAADLTAEMIPPPTQITGTMVAAQSWTWLYSGNLGRAHEWRPILAQRGLEDRALPIQLLFEGGGAMWKDAQRFASELKLKNCRWCETPTKRTRCRSSWPAVLSSLLSGLKREVCFGRASSRASSRCKNR